jgi:putative PIN family toxin of toxin-antitoxin system
MRVVLDTVVFVRGLINPRSVCGRLVFDHAASFELIVSPELVGEYLGVFARPSLAAKIGPFEAGTMQTVLRLLHRAHVFQPETIPQVCRDPNDDKFLAAAITGGATYIVSEDRDLLDLGSYEDVTILSAAAFLAVLERGTD